MALLVEKFIEHGYGIYLADCRKYCVYDHREPDIYSSKKKILEKEFEIINGSHCRNGQSGINYCRELLGDEHRLEYVPWKAKGVFDMPENQKVSVEELAKNMLNRLLANANNNKVVSKCNFLRTCIGK